MPRCRPGDLAVVINGENCGAFVDVMYATEPRLHMSTWACMTRSPVTANLLCGEVPVREMVMPAGSTVHFFDADLQPIRPQPKEETLPDREVEHDTV